MARNHKGVGDRVTIFAAAAAVTSGVATVENNFAGIPVTSAAIGDAYELMTEGEFALPAVTGVGQGDLVFITDATGALAAAGATGLRQFGKCTREEGSEGVPTGFMWVRISPYTHAAVA